MVLPLEILGGLAVDFLDVLKHVGLGDSLVAWHLLAPLQPWTDNRTPLTIAHLPNLVTLEGILLR